jgi:hypothetical protein
MYVPESFGKHDWQLLIKILMVLLGFFESIIYELQSLAVLLIDVCLQPRQIEAIYAKGDQVKQGLDVVDGTGVLAELEFSD